VGMLSARPEEEEFVGRGGDSEPLPTSLCCKLPQRGPERIPGKNEFGAFWDLKIASKQCKWNLICS